MLYTFIISFPYNLRLAQFRLSVEKFNPQIVELEIPATDILDSWDIEASSTYDGWIA